MLGISVNRHGNIQSRKKNTKQRQPAKKIRPGSEVELYLRRTKWANRSFARPGLMVRNKLCWDRQITQCDFQNKGTLTSVARLFFVLSLIALFASLHKKTSFRFVSNILWFVMLICVSSRTLMWREQQTLNPNTSHNRAPDPTLYLPRPGAHGLLPRHKCLTASKPKWNRKKLHK